MMKMEIVLPGKFIDEKKGRKISETVYEEDGKVYSKVIGIPKISETEINVIPLSGRYKPRIGDMVIGIIKEVELSGWIVEINSPYYAFLPISEAVEEFVDLTKTDISRFFDIEEKIFCKIKNVTKNKVVHVSMKDQLAKKLKNGILTKMTPFKVARLIGRGGSMINMIKELTKCEIYVGQNGLIWIVGENYAKVIEAINIIERESHFSGLTEKIKKMLSY